MRHQPHCGWARCTRGHTALLHTLHQGMGIETGHVEIEFNKQDIGLHVVGIESDPFGLRDPLGQKFGVMMVLSEPFDVVLKGIDPRRCDNAGLAHATAEHFAKAVGSFDKIGTAREQGADRGAQAFGEAERRSVEILRDLLGGNPHRNTGVEEAGAVEMHRDVLRQSEVVNVANRLRGIYGAAASVVRVFEADQAGWGVMRVLPAANLRGNLVGGDDAALSSNLIDLHAREGCDPAGFGAKGVIALFHDNFITGLGMGLDAELVGHGTGRDKQSCFIAEKIGGHVLQAIDRRVFAKDIVADLSVCHGLSHLGGGLGYGIATQIDHGGLQLLYLAGPFATKNLDCRARHIDVIIRFAPLQFKCTAKQVPGDAPSGFVIEMTGHGHR